MVKKRRTGLRGLDPGRRLGFRSIFVEPYLQIKLGLFIIILNLLFASAIGGVFSYYIYDVYQAISMYFELDQAENVMTWEKFQVPLLICGGLVISFIVLTLIITARYTHKIYGPLVNIHSFLDLALKGHKPEPLKLRSSDQLNDLAIKINQLYEKSK